MTIVQFSPIRSGSTLVFNYLLELGKNPVKRHNYIKKKDDYYIITIRHPYNSIISSILRYGKDINIDTLSEHIQEYLVNGGNCIIENDFTEDEKHCVLIYEDFFKNHDIILNNLEVFFGEKYSLELRNKVKFKLNIDEVKRQIDKNCYTNFFEYDSYTHFHGKHISEFNGYTDYKKILSKEALHILQTNKKLSKIIEKYYF